MSESVLCSSSSSSCEGLEKRNSCCRDIIRVECCCTPQHYCESCMMIRVCDKKILLVMQQFTLKWTTTTHLWRRWWWWSSYICRHAHATNCTLVVLNNRSLLGISFFCPVSGNRGLCSHAFVCIADQYTVRFWLDAKARALLYTSHIIIIMSLEFVIVSNGHPW